MHGPACMLHNTRSTFLVSSRLVSSRILQVANYPPNQELLPFYNVHLICCLITSLYVGLFFRFLFVELLTHTHPHTHPHTPRLFAFLPRSSVLAHPTKLHPYRHRENARFLWKRIPPDVKQVNTL